MNEETIKKLNQINIDFYKQTAIHFDKTRQYAWEGWDTISKQINKAFTAPLDILDIGCGNGRFAKFLIEKKHNLDSYLGIDQDISLLKFATDELPATALQFESSNLLEIDFKEKYDQKYNLITLFGVMHHVPSYKKREDLVTDLYKILKPGGLFAISYWDFMADDRFKSKIIPWGNLQINESDVEKNDYLLDWQRGTTAIRYCHYADDDELQTIIKKVNADDVSQFVADGKTHRLNKYLVFGKNSD